MTDEEIIAIRDAFLPSQGESFDCIGFARAIIKRENERLCPLARLGRWALDQVSNDDLSDDLDSWELLLEAHSLGLLRNEGTEDGMKFVETDLAQLDKK